MRIDSGNGGGDRFIKSVRITVTLGQSADQQIDDLIVDVENLGPAPAGSDDLNDDQVNSLVKKLENVQKKLDQGKEKPAINNMQAFINKVNAFACDSSDPECDNKVHLYHQAPMNHSRGRLSFLMADLQKSSSYSRLYYRFLD